MIMKNQLLNLKMIALMCLMMVLGGANVWAQETKSVTCTLGADATACTSTGDCSVSWKYSSDPTTTDQVANGMYWAIGSSETVTLTAKLSATDATITSVVIKAYTNKGTGKTIDVTVGGNKFGNTITLTKNSTDYNLTGSATGDLVLSMKSTSDKKSHIIKTVTINYTESSSSTKTLKSLAISGTPTKTTYNAGDAFDPTGLTVTGTYDDNTTAEIKNDINWTVTPAKLTTETTSCTVTASVGGVKSEPFEVNGLKVVRTISLSIDPTTSTVVKAPVTVTLTATEGATVYYTTNGEVPTINSEKYIAPFEVTTSGTTVKALAVAEGAENVTAEAAYTIKPEQPLFSDESKTFKNAFDVTLSLPESTDATSKIHYAIGAKATAESPVYEKPINISAENDGDKVILHAVVVDKYGNVGKEKFCTYTKTNTIVFDFTSDWEGITATAVANNQNDGEQVVAGKELKVEGVVMTATNKTTEYNGTTKTYYTGLYTSNNSQTLRVYGSVTFTAPEGYNLSEVTFTGTSTDKFTTADKAYKNSTWTGNAHAVTFTASSSVQVKTATIKLVAVEPVKPTFGTLDFKAQDGDGFRYATFSSDKDVVFNQKSVDVYAVSVSNEKVDTKILDAASYNVTDATVGSIEKGYYVPAYTGVLIVGYDATTTYYFPAEAQTVTLPANQLKPAPANGGVFEATADYKYYKLAYGNWTNKTQLGFYWGADNGGAFYVKAGTAYLAVPASDATAKGFAFNGETTGIEGVNANVENAKAIYNLNGQRVASMAKPGLYIVNGKKVVRK